MAKTAVVAKRTQKLAKGSKQTPVTLRKESQSTKIDAMEIDEPIEEIFEEEEEGNNDGEDDDEMRDTDDEDEEEEDDEDDDEEEEEEEDEENDNVDRDANVLEIDIEKDENQAVSGDEDEEEDIDAAIQKADAKKNKKETMKQRRQYLSLIGELNTVEEIQSAMRKAFHESQTTVAAHKRQLVILKAVMHRAISMKVMDDFTSFFCLMLNKVLPIKKNLKCGDKVVKFVSSFFEMMNPANEYLSSGDMENESNETVRNMSASALEEVFNTFMERVIKYLMKGLVATNTTVRYRICQLLSYIISNCGGVDEDLYKALSDELTARIYDKDAPVRMKAISALACFQNDDGESLSLAGKKIRFVMQNDPRAEVRRSCLKHIEKNRFTEPYIVERARDVDSVNRRLLFSKILPTYRRCTDLSPESRKKLLSWGLRDRDESVRKAAANWLTNTWMHDFNNNIHTLMLELDVTENEISDTAVRTLLDKRPSIVTDMKLDELFLDGLTPQSTLLMRIIFEYCQDNDMSNIIEDQFPEAAAFASLLEKYLRMRDENLAKISMLNEQLREHPELAEEHDIIDPDDHNYIIMQLLKIAVDYDYSDEYGRNKMYTILRRALSNNTITEPILPILMECLRKLATNERDFCQMTVEIINDMRDSEYDRVMEARHEEEARKKAELEVSVGSKKNRNTRSSGKPDKDEELEELNERVKRILADDGEDSQSDEDEYHSAVGDMSRQSMIEANKSRQEELDQVSQLSPSVLTDCLTITKCMLQLVFAPLRENMMLISLLENFIVPCVNQRSEVEVRELALICHGLCGLLDKETAVATMVIAGIFVTRSDYESFVVTGLKVIGDLLTIHGLSILQSENQRSIDTMAVAKVFYRTLKDENKPEAQSVVAVTLFKLFLCGVINDEELFETTLLTYFNPKVNRNPPLKQCLTFCIPTYAFSKKSHQELIASVAYDTIKRLFKDWDSISQYNRELELRKPITASQIIESFLYWTDPYNLAMAEDEDSECSSVHLEFGIQLMRLMKRYDYHNKMHRVLYKPVIRALAKLTFTSKADIEKLREFRDCFDDGELCQGDLNEVLNSDSTCKNSFLRAHTYIQECLKEAEEREATAAISTETAEAAANAEADADVAVANKEEASDVSPERPDFTDPTTVMKPNEDNGSDDDDEDYEAVEFPALNNIEAQSSMIVASEAEEEDSASVEHLPVEENVSDVSIDVVGETTLGEVAVKPEAIAIATASATASAAASPGSRESPMTVSIKREKLRSLSPNPATSGNPAKPKSSGFSGTAIAPRKEYESRLKTKLKAKAKAKAKGKSKAISSRSGAGSISPPVINTERGTSSRVGKPSLKAMSKSKAKTKTKKSLSVSRQAPTPQVPDVISLDSE
jgi:condensin complex subunit 3